MMEIILKIMPFNSLDDAAQWCAFGLNLAYVVLAGRGSAWCWVFGFGGTIFQFIVCVDANLKSDAALQVYYSLSAIYGWFSWRQRNTEGGQLLGISTLSGASHLKIAGLATTAAILLGFYWQNAAFRFEDAALAVFSIAATLLTARKILENWLYWLVIDASYALIYADRDKYLLAILSVVYFIFSIRGFFRWQQLMRFVKV